MDSSTPQSYSSSIHIHILQACAGTHIPISPRNAYRSSFSLRFLASCLPLVPYVGALAASAWALDFSSHVCSPTTGNKLKLWVVLERATFQTDRQLIVIAAAIKARSGDFNDPEAREDKDEVGAAPSYSTTPHSGFNTEIPESLNAVPCIGLRVHTPANFLAVLPLLEQIKRTWS